MNAKRALYIQSIRGPVLLITIGVLFSVHQAGILSFGRTWPLLFIVIGLMKLLERAFAPANPWQEPSQNAAAYQYGPYATPPYTPYPQSPASRPVQPPNPPPPASQGGVQQ